MSRANFASVNTASSREQEIALPVLLPGVMQNSEEVFRLFPLASLRNRGARQKYISSYALEIYEKALKQIFDARVREWMEDTRWHSSIGSITHHPQFQELVSMGQPIMPLVLQRLVSGDLHVHWFPLLKDLAKGADPVPAESRGHIADMAAQWVAWGRR